MRKYAFGAGWMLFLLALCGSDGIRAQQSAAKATAPAPSSRAFVDTYCVSCHSDALKTGGLTLQSADLANVPAAVETWEKVIRKVRANAMPPQGARHPEKPATEAFLSYLEASIDSASRAKPNPGQIALHRLNRAEYGNAVRDVLGLKIDPTPLLPIDDAEYGFDNIADVLKTSPSLMQRYVSAAWEIARLAVNDTGIGPEATIYRSKPDLSQNVQMEGFPIGTRGGLKVEHNFPVDGEYEISARLWRTTTDIIRGLEDTHQIELSVDGARVHLANFGGTADRDLSYKSPFESDADIDRRLTFRVPIKAGMHSIMATFVWNSETQYDGILQPFIRTNHDTLSYRGLPAVDWLTVAGPFHVTGTGESPSRRQIFVCHPANEKEELPCAKKIIQTLARRAYRRPTTTREMEKLVSFYDSSRKDGGSFNEGIEGAIQLILTSPEFLFRLERDPANVSAGAVYRIDDLALASRLSFFLWSSVPDDELLSLASAGKLRDPRVLESQVTRLLKDPRAEALIENFAGQYLSLRSLATIVPDYHTFPDFDDNLRQSMKRETELFFDSIIREDRSVMDLLNADYTFLNERLARHYGMTGIYGSHFRRVTLDNENRRGLLGQASLLTLTSYANRTSPVLRGQWILTNILGLPPSPPPANVPNLKDSSDFSNPTSLRERLELHRAVRPCAGCHRVMDPVGFALENFDAVGRWRSKDDGVPIDSSGMLFNGTATRGPSDLRKALTEQPEIFTGALTEKLLTYALGRGVQYYDMPAIREILKGSAAKDYRFSSVVLNIVKSTPFQMKVRNPGGSR